MSTDGPVIMLVTPNLDVGGAQETVRQLARYLPRAGARTVVCSFGDGPLRAEIEADGTPVEMLPARRHSVIAVPSFLAEMIARRRDVVRLVQAHGVDVVLTQGLGTLDFLIMSLRWRSRTAVWWTIQNAQFTLRREHLNSHTWLFGPKRVVHRWLYRLGSAIVDGVIAVSDETARSFAAETGTPTDRIHVVCNAVDTEAFDGVRDRAKIRAQLGFGADEHVMTAVATFKRQKGHRFLIEAIASLAPRFPRLRLLLIGDGELADDIRADVDSRGLSGAVQLLGTRRDIPDLLASSDSFVLPSLWEGLPVALIEAMASGLPVVATRVSGTEQVVEDGSTGWLVPPGDPSALAKAIAKLLSDPVRATAVAAAGRVRVNEEFGAAAQAERLLRLFEGRAPVAADAALGSPRPVAEDAR
jgi:glycosyltransferase involved in cell wall biosynthesis